MSQVSFLRNHQSVSHAGCAILLLLGRAFPQILTNTRDYPSFSFQSSSGMWCGFSLWFWFAFLWQLMSLSIFSCSVQFSRSVVSDSLQPHEMQHAMPPCPSPTPRVHPNPCPLSRWCHSTTSSSVVPFSSSTESANGVEKCLFKFFVHFICQFTELQVFIHFVS